MQLRDYLALLKTSISAPPASAEWDAAAIMMLCPTMLIVGASSARQEGSGMERVAYSVVEVAERLSISRDLVYSALRSGELGSIKVGRRRLITEAHLQAFLTQKGAKAR